MTDHAPKQHALEAYLAGRLGPDGRARLERHLAGCATCRAAARRMRLYHDTAGVLRDASLPEIDWDRIEASLPEADASRAEPIVRRRWLWPLAAVAAAAAIAWLGQAPAPDANRTAEKTGGQTAATTPLDEPRAPAEGWVTLAANAVQSVGRDGEPAPLDPARALREDASLRTGPTGSLHVRLGQGTGFALAGAGALELATLRQGRTRLRLSEGRVTCEVAPLGDGDAFVVEAGEHSVHVQGTRFAVEHRDGETRVQVEEGRVEVRRGDVVQTVLQGGSQWTSGAVPDAGNAPTASPKVVGLEPAGEEVWLLVRPAPMVQAWLPAGESSPVKAEQTLRMRLPPGPGSLQVLDRGGKLQQVQYTLAPEGGELTEAELRRQLAPPEPRAGTLEVAQIMPVLKRGMAGLRTCYERALRGGHRGGVELALQLRVAPSGAVDRVEVEGEGIDPGLAQCVRARARRWAFPKPEGGPAHLRLPVHLRPRR